MSKVTVGSVINNWKVISEKYEMGGKPFADCECICGNQKPVKWHLLNSCKTMGCGCSSEKSRFSAQCVGSLSKSYYTSFKYSRTSKGKDFDDNVTMEFLWALFVKQGKKCAISGVDIVLNPRWSQQNKGRITKYIQNASIDRIESNKGYTVDNIQWVHKNVNYMKGMMSDNDFISICKAVAEKHKDSDVEGAVEVANWGCNQKISNE